MYTPSYISIKYYTFFFSFEKILILENIIKSITILSEVYISQKIYAATQSTEYNLSYLSKHFMLPHSLHISTSPMSPTESYKALIYIVTKIKITTSLYQFQNNSNNF